MWPALIVAGVGVVLIAGLFLWTRPRRAPVAMPPAPARPTSGRSPEDPAAAAERAAARAAHAREISRIQTALRTRVCPRCGASPVTGEDKFLHSVSIAGGGGGLAYRLELHCPACGLREGAMDLR